MSKNLCGVYLFHKPKSVSSHSVVSGIRKCLKVNGLELKVGHLGTLDPFADGLLPILIGGATRLTDFLHQETKQYLFTIQFGKETTTLDPYGETVLEKEVPDDLGAVTLAIKDQFIGKIEQVPPAYSALKVNGRPLYEYMRTVGKLPIDIQEKKREVQIHSLEIVSIDDEKHAATFRAVCSKGTYIRSLARDIAYACHTCGYCLELTREKIGPWSMENLEKFEFPLPTEKIWEDMIGHIIPAEKLFPEFPVLKLSDEKQNHFFIHGNAVTLNGSWDSKYLFVYGINDEVLFLCEQKKISPNETQILPKIKMY